MKILPLIVGVVFFVGPVRSQAPIVVDSTVRYFKYTDSEGIHHRRCVTRIVLPASVPEKLDPRGIHRIRSKGTTLSFPRLEKYDTLIVSVQPEGMKELKDIVLSQNGKELRSVYLNLQDTIVLRDTGALELKVRSKKWVFFQKKFAMVELVRYPAVTRDTQYQIFDTTFFANVRGAENPRDTAWVPLADLQLSPANTLNILDSPVRIEKIEIPLAAEKVGPLAFLGLWVGLGREAGQAYDELEAAIPKEWAPPGVPAALGAYSMGFQKVLPTFCREEVLFAFTDSLQKDVFLQVVRRDPVNPPDAKALREYVPAFPLSSPPCYYALLDCTDLPFLPCPADQADSTAANFDLYFSVVNYHTVDAIPVSLKMIGCYISPLSYSSSEELKIKEINVFQEPCK